MKLKKLGQNGPLVSPISMGTRFSVENPNEADAMKKRVLKTLELGIDSGINFLNTADFYGMGMSELLIGEAIKYRKDKVVISVKTGAVWKDEGNFVGMDCRPETIKNNCDASLMRLGVEAIDIYQAARVDPNVPIEETVGAIKDLIDEGKVKYLGLSEVSAEHIRRAHAVHPVTALEIEYSLATRFIEKEILPTTRELGISVVPYSVLHYGLLSGNLQNPLSSGDYRVRFPRFYEENLQHNLEKVEVLKNIAQAKGLSAGELALAWVLQQGEDIIPIIGMTRPERVEQNLAALEIEFTQDELELLDITFADGEIKGTRYPEALMSIVPS